MFYNGQPSSTNNWPSNVKYPNYHPDQRLKILWLLALAFVSLTLTVAALIIVFAVESSWFSDSFNQTYTNHYGLWRLCFFPNQTCDSWFSTDTPYSYYVQQRLNQNKGGISAWQALEIIFLFLIASTFIITFISIIFYRLQKSVHYYLVILAGFCIWPAALVGISDLFVFGFAVFNVSQTPHYLDWCYYVNLVAVILSVITAIFLTIYDILLKRPMKNDEDDDAVIETFDNINGYQATFNPATFVVVRRNKKKRKNSYDYPQILYPHQYFPTRTAKNYSNNDHITNPNYKMFAPYTSVINNQQINSSPIQQQYRDSGLLTSPSVTSIPPQSRHYQPPISSYSYQQPYWHRTQTNPTNYNAEFVNDYIQRGIYRPNQLNPIEQKEEPRVLHYYTGFDHFSTIDPSDIILTRHHPPLSGPGSAVRHAVNPSFYQQNDYLRSAM